jgi:hypothetical protein
MWSSQQQKNDALDPRIEFFIFNEISHDKNVIVCKLEHVRDHRLQNRVRTRRSK